MKHRIIFLLMSAVSKRATVDQLAQALAPHLVLVHHDFSQSPDFKLTASNVMFVPEPKRTGWGVFGFVEGIFHSLRYANRHLDYDYLQLLTPSCLPIKPINQFEAHVMGDAEAHFDCVDLTTDADALLSVGYRAFAPDRSYRHRVGKRLAMAAWTTATDRRDVAGIWLPSGFGKAGRPNLISRIAFFYNKALRNPTIGRHIFDSTMPPYYGTTWFGARRRVIAEMVAGFDRPGVREHFSGLRIADEFLIPTLLMQIGARKGPMNHYVHTFQGAHPGRLEDRDFDMLRRRPEFFARKFADDAQAAIRVRVLEELAGFRAPAFPAAEMV
jgi:hypothetical protein